MATTASNEELSQAILQQVEYGAYPESENVASAEIPPAALPALLDAVDKAREGVQVYTIMSEIQYSILTLPIGRTSPAQPPIGARH
jgi:hypothetical protein